MPAGNTMNLKWDDAQVSDMNQKETSKTFCTSFFTFEASKEKVTQF